MLQSRMNKILRDLYLVLLVFQFLSHFSSSLPHNFPFYHWDFGFTPLILFILNSFVLGLIMLGLPVFFFLAKLIPAEVISLVWLGREFWTSGHRCNLPFFKVFFCDQVRFLIISIVGRLILFLFFQGAKLGSYLDFLATSR